MSVTVIPPGNLFQDGRLDSLRVAFLTEHARDPVKIPEVLVYYLRALEAQVLSHDAQGRKRFAEESMSFENLRQDAPK